VTAVVGAGYVMAAVIALRLHGLDGESIRMRFGAAILAMPGVDADDARYAMTLVMESIEATRPGREERLWEAS
jgi:hypothetical protein